MSSALPSFVELMASLGLSTDSENANGGRSRSNSDSSSSSPSPSLLHVPLSPRSVEECKSPSIVISECDSAKARDPDAPFKRRASSGNIKAARYTPYSSITSRRGSLSTISDRENELARASASFLASRRSSAQNAKLNAPRTRQASGSLADIKTASCTPISSFARRRSPQASPTSPSFSQRMRGMSSEPPPPVSLPTLPPLLAQSFASYSFPPVPPSDAPATEWSRSPSLSPTQLPEAPDSVAFVKQHQAGLRISSLCRASAHQNYMESRQVSPLA